MMFTAAMTLLLLLAGLLQSLLPPLVWLGQAKAPVLMALATYFAIAHGRVAMMCVADGASVISENIFENRFMHVSELQRFGADITVEGSTATVKGVKKLSGAPGADFTDGADGVARATSVRTPSGRPAVSTVRRRTAPCAVSSSTSIGNILSHSPRSCVANISVVTPGRAAASNSARAAGMADACVHAPRSVRHMAPGVAPGLTS